MAQPGFGQSDQATRPLFAQTEGMDLTLALTILVTLTALIAATATLRHVIGGDGYGRRTPPPTSNDTETRSQTFTRLAA